jgi:hypothetical protein
MRATVGDDGEAARARAASQCLHAITWKNRAGGVSPALSKWIDHALLSAMKVIVLQQRGSPAGLTELSLGVENGKGRCGVRVCLTRTVECDWFTPSSRLLIGSIVIHSSITSN